VAEVTNIRVDFNSIGQDGYLKGHLSRADGPVFPGDTVEAWEDDELRFRLTVHSVADQIVRMERPNQRKHPE
jgi:hypothetical protein